MAKDPDNAAFLMAQRKLHLCRSNVHGSELINNCKHSLSTHPQSPGFGRRAHDAALQAIHLWLLLEAMKFDEVTNAEVIHVHFLTLKYDSPTALVGAGFNRQVMVCY